MQFSRRWWVDDYEITHGVTVTDLAIRNVVYTPAGQDPTLDKGVIIASYAWEQDSMAYSMLDESQRISQALEDLCKIHPEARDTFEFGVSHDWALDRHGGGIGPLFRPYEMTSRFYDDIMRPVGRIWFASDACDQPGAALDRGRDRVRRQERVRHPRRACATSSRSRTSSEPIPAVTAPRPQPDEVPPVTTPVDPELLETADEGLDRRPHGPKRVVVIGGGLAGLVAAFELKRQGHEADRARGAEPRRRPDLHAAHVRARAVRRGGRHAHPARPRPDAALLRAVRPADAAVRDGQPARAWSTSAASG